MFFKESLVFHSNGRSNYRIPSMIVTNNGTLLAFCNDRKDTLSDHADEVALVLCKKAPGGDWGCVRELEGIPGWHCSIGSAVYDSEIGKAFIFVGRSPVTRNEFGKYTPEQIEEMNKRAEEAAKKLAEQGKTRGYFRLTSTDDGETWTEEVQTVAAASQIHIDGKYYDVVGSTHGSAHGIQLRHGEHKGRLLCPARTCIGHYNTLEGLRLHSYNCAVYSDDHGKTWQTSNCVQIGTGEGTLIENADGSITYNSRAYFTDQKRYLATSNDGGATYGDFRTDDFLIEPVDWGCNASFIRVELDEIKDKSALPEGAENVTVFCNPRAEHRDNMTACVSFDSGKTWKHVKLINPGLASYSSIVWNPVTQTFAVLYEKGEKHCCGDGLAVAEFDLEWLLSE